MLSTIDLEKLPDERLRTPKMNAPCVLILAIPFETEFCTVYHIISGPFIYETPFFLYMTKQVYIIFMYMGGN